MTLTSMKRWEPVDAPLQNKPGERSSKALRDVLAQFHVTTNPRYAPSGGQTFCNIFSWDCTRALHAEIPHWVRDDQGKRELNANATLAWLLKDGPAAGWREVDQVVAALRSSVGFPTVAIWKNPANRPGHIAVLLPPHLDRLRIAQAGKTNHFDVPLTKGFGTVKPIRFFTHD